MWGVISSTASTIRCLKSAISRTFLLYTTPLINPHAKMSNGVKSGDLGGQAVGPAVYNTSLADKHVARAWMLFRYLSSYNRCPHWSVQTCIKIFLSYSVHWWKHIFHKAFRYQNISTYFSIPLSRTSCIYIYIHIYTYIYIYIYIFAFISACCIARIILAFRYYTWLIQGDEKKKYIYIYIHIYIVGATLLCISTN